jgi:hypothetical protein
MMEEPSAARCSPSFGRMRLKLLLLQLSRENFSPVMVYRAMSTLLQGKRRVDVSSFLSMSNIHLRSLSQFTFFCVALQPGVVFLGLQKRVSQHEARC